MKKTHFIELINNIRKTKVSFVSIFTFVALGIAIFLSFSWVNNALNMSANKYVHKYNLHDLEILFPFGFSPEDIEYINSLPFVKATDGRRFTYDYFAVGNDVYQAKITEITNDVDCLHVLEGRRPEAIGEIAIDYVFAKDKGLNLNDIIVLNSSSADSETKYFNTDTFVITALIVSPEYASKPIIYGSAIDNGINVDCGIWVDSSSIRESAFLGYTDVVITCNELEKMDYTTDEYKQTADQYKSQLIEAISPVIEDKKAVLLVSYEKMLDDANKQLNDARIQIKDKEQELTDGQKQLNHFINEYNQGEIAIKDGQSQLQEAEKELAEGKEKLDDAKAQIDDGKKMLAPKEAEYNKSYAKWQEGVNKLEAGKKELAEGKSKYAYYKRQYEDAKRDLAVVKGIATDIHIIVRDLECGVITASNYNQYMSQWDIEGMIRTAMYLKQKYSNRNDMSESMGDISINLERHLYNLSLALSYSDVSNSPQIVYRELDAILYDIDRAIYTVDGKLWEKGKELDDSLAKIKDGEEEVRKGQQEVDEGKKQLDAGRKLLDSKKKELKTAQTEYDSFMEEFNKKEEEYNQGKELLEEKIKELNAGKKEIQEGEKQIEEGFEQLDEAKVKLSTAEHEYNSNLDKLQLLKPDSKKAAFSVINRSSLIYLNTITVILSILNTVRFSMASLFVIIGALVCYSAITRIVYSQSSQIGAKKALGMDTKEISTYYLMYSGISTFLGCIMGIVLAYICENYIVKALLNSFMFDEHTNYVNVGLTVGACLAQIALILIVTYVSAINILKKDAIDLLNGNNELVNVKKPYEKLKVYRNLSSFNKIIVNNCLTEKRRVFGTVIGITGCTALAVTSLTFKNNIDNSFIKQFSDYTHYHYIVFYDNSMKDADNEVEAVLRSYTDNVAKCKYSFMYEEQPSGEHSAMRVFIPTNIDDFKKVYTPKAKEAILGSNPYEGVWVHYAYRNFFKDEALPGIKVADASGEVKEIPITGFYDDYLTFGSMTISSDRYKEIYGNEPDYNAFLVDENEDTMELINAQLTGVNGYIKTDDYFYYCKNLFNTFKGLSLAIVSVYLTLAVIMSLLVLLNLLCQFVDEKKKEIIILLINGYDYNYARKYIYADTIILTIISVFLGAILGTVLGIITLCGFDSPVLYFIRRISIPSCLIGIVYTVVLSFVMCVIALRRIDKFHLTDISKY